MGAEFGATTGRPRRCGWFDAVALRRSIVNSSVSGLCVTKLDVLDELETIRICVGYEIDGEAIPGVPVVVDRFAECVPVYEEHAGWQESTVGITNFADLPQQARDYLARIEGRASRSTSSRRGPIASRRSSSNIRSSNTLASGNLVFKAGPGAFDLVRRHGFAPELIGTIAGASGGAKWLVLSQLDRVIVETVLPRLRGPVHLIGTSIGSWRFACYAQKDPVKAIERFEDAYIHQRYSDAPDIREITAKSREILDVILGDSGREEILDNPNLRTHIMTVRARHIAATERPHVLAATLLAAASLNAISRRTLGWFFERALFFDARDLPPFFDVTGFPLQRVMLQHDNRDK